MIARLKSEATTRKIAWFVVTWSCTAQKEPALARAQVARVIFGEGPARGCDRPPKLAHGSQSLRSMSKILSLCGLVVIGVLGPVGCIGEPAAEPVEETTVRDAEKSAEHLGEAQQEDAVGAIFGSVGGALAGGIFGGLVFGPWGGRVGGLAGGATGGWYGGQASGDRPPWSPPQALRSFANPNAGRF